MRCHEWAPQQVEAFRLMVNRSVTWADWDSDLLALELLEIKESDFDLRLTGFDVDEIERFWASWWPRAVCPRPGTWHLMIYAKGEQVISPVHACSPDPVPPRCRSSPEHRCLG